MNQKLTESEKIRYARHLNIPDFGIEGQIKLKSASVLIVGCGGLGSSSALYLAAAGVGKIGLADSDVVELSNLQRQVIHSQKNVDKPKVVSAQERIADLNGNVAVEIFQERVDKSNVDEIIGNYPIVVDATDNFKTRYVLNDSCAKKHIPFVYGAIYQFSGQMCVFNFQDGPCFKCVFMNEPEEDYVEANRGVGVVGALPGVIGALQAIEVIKMVTGLGKVMTERLLIFDGLDMDFKEIAVSRHKTCPVCAN